MNYLHTRYLVTLLAVALSTGIHGMEQGAAATNDPDDSGDDISFFLEQVGAQEARALREQYAHQLFFAGKHEKISDLESAFQELSQDLDPRHHADAPQAVREAYRDIFAQVKQEYNDVRRLILGVSSVDDLAMSALIDNNPRLVDIVLKQKPVDEAWLQSWRRSAEESRRHRLQHFLEEELSKGLVKSAHKK